MTRNSGEPVESGRPSLRTGVAAIACAVVVNLFLVGGLKMPRPAAFAFVMVAEVVAACLVGWPYECRQGSWRAGAIALRPFFTLLLFKALCWGSYVLLTEYLFLHYIVAHLICLAIFGPVDQVVGRCMVMVSPEEESICEVNVFDFIRKHRVFSAVFFLAIAAFAVRFGRIKNALIAADGRQYVTMAYNLDRYGVASIDTSVAAGQLPKPTSYRSVGYPAFMAVFFRLFPSMREIPMAKEEIIGMQKKLLPIIYAQKILLLLTALGAMYLVWKFSGSHWASLVPLVALIFYSDTTDYASFFLTEIISMFLFVLLTILFVVALERKHWAAFLGFSLAITALTMIRASFMYFYPFIVLFFLLPVWRDRRCAKKVVVGILIYTICLFTAVGAWKARNKHHFGRSFMAQRGGTSVLIRSKINQLTRREYLASFFYWSRSDFIKQRIMPRYFTEEDLKKFDRVLTVPDSNGPDSAKPTMNPENFFVLSYARRGYYRKQGFNDAMVDKKMMDEGLAVIKKHPLRHLLAAITLLHRGSCIEKSYLLNLFLVISTFILLALAAWKRNGSLAAMLFPLFLLFGFNAGITHGLPRYNVPALPIIWAAATILWCKVVFCLRQRRQRSHGKLPEDAKEGFPEDTQKEAVQDSAVEMVSS